MPVGIGSCPTGRKQATAEPQHALVMPFEVIFEHVKQEQSLIDRPHTFQVTPLRLVAWARLPHSRPLFNVGVPYG